MGPGNLYGPSTSQYQDPNTGGIVILPGMLRVSCWGQHWILFHTPMFLFTALLWRFPSHSVSPPVRWRDVVGIQRLGLRREECFFCFPPPNSSPTKAQGLIITTNTTIGRKMIRPFWNCSPRAWLADLSWQCIPQTSWMALQPLKLG